MTLITCELLKRECTLDIIMGSRDVFHRALFVLQEKLGYPVTAPGSCGRCRVPLQIATRAGFPSSISAQFAPTDRQAIVCARELFRFSDIEDPSLPREIVIEAGKAIYLSDRVKDYLQGIK